MLGFDAGLPTATSGFFAAALQFAQNMVHIFPTGLFVFVRLA
jgi:hypothetical protein